MDGLIRRVGRQVVGAASLFFAAGMARAEVPPASAYVHDGLVFELDGIENVGLGQHSDSPSSLVDLIGGKTVTLNATEKAATTANSFYLAPASGMYSVKNVLSARPTAITMEVCMKMATVPSDSNYAAVLHVANGSASIGYCATGSGLTMSFYHSGMKLFYNVTHPFGETPSTITASSAPYYRYVEVASDSMEVPTLYVNLTNSVTPSSGQSISWSADNHVYLGNSRAKAHVRAMRVYTRVLTDAERARNDALDRMRFEDATSNDTGYAWIDEALCARLTVASDENGTVQATGASLGESWPAIGATVTLTPVPGAGAAFNRWEGDTNGLAVAESGAITFAADVPRALTCTFTKAKPVATTGVSAKAYVQDGLVAQWDGVENWSYGQRYADVRAFGWVDLIGGCTLTTNIAASGSITTTANGVSLLNSTLRAYDTNGKATALANVIRQAPRTIEIAGANGESAAAATWLSVVHARTSSAAESVFLWNVEDVGGAYKSVFRVAASGGWANSAGNGLGFAANADFTRAVAFSGLAAGSCYTNGLAEGVLSFTGTPVEFDEMSEAGITLGATACDVLPSGNVSVDVHAVRVYNRQLTATEIRRNRAFDRMRFEDATSNDTGYAWVDEALRIRFKATTTQWGATVSVNGEGTGQAAELWRSEDASAEIAYVATVPSGFIFKKWVGETDGLSAADLAKATLTVAADRARALEATYENAGPSGPQVRTWTGEAGDGLWSNPFNWTTEAGYVGAPSDDDDIVIPYGSTVTCDESTAALKSLAVGGTLKQKNWDTCVNAETITISNKAVVTCVGPFTDGAMSNRVYLACTDLDIRSGGKIDVSKLGYCLTNGPCWIGISSKQGKGAAHGGLSSDGGTRCYGSVSEPTAPGSGGGYWNAGTGTSVGCGGGAVYISAKGQVTVNGNIWADGDVSSSWSQAGGSGGSVYIGCRTIAGSGTVSASSTDALGMIQPGGGGGRIAVHYDAASQQTASCSVGFMTHGGAFTAGGTPSRVAAGYPGTLWFTDDQFLTNATYTALGWRFQGEWNSGSGATKLILPNDVDIASAGLIFKSPLTEVDFQGNLSVTGCFRKVNGVSTGGSMTYQTGVKGVKMHVGGDLYVNGARLIVEGCSLRVDGNLTLGHATTPGYRCAPEMTLTAAPTNGLTEAWGAEVSVGGTLSFNVSSIAYIEGSSTNGAIPRIAAQNVYVNSGSTLMADNRGWATQKGPGRSTDHGHGASYGGKGDGTDAPATYGSEKHPLDLGSGGYNGPRGGGAIYVCAEKRLRIDGTVTANGQKAETWKSGGSGGSIYFETWHLLPSVGTLTASAVGGDGVNGCRPSGGGRIAIWSHGGSTNGMSFAVQPGSTKLSATAGTVHFHRLRPMCVIVR